MSRRWMAPVWLLALPLCPAQPTPRPGGGGTLVTLQIDSFDCPETERLSEHDQLPGMLSGSLHDLFNNSVFLQVTFIEKGKSASILNAAKGYGSAVRAETATQILEKTKPDYLISVKYHKVGDKYRMGGAVLNLKDGRSYPVGWVTFVPHPEDPSDDPFRDLAFRLKHEIYKLERIPVSETRFSLTVCGPELSGLNNAEILGQMKNQIGNTLLSRFSSVSLTNISLVDPIIRDCAGSQNPNELRVAASFIYEVDPATGRRRVHYFVRIQHQIRGLAAADDRICDEEQLFATLQEVVAKIRERWEQKVVTWDEVSMPANTGAQR